MSCDIRTTQPSTGHGVFIARLPFGIQAKDVAEAFQEFGPIVGGTDGIQVRPRNTERPSFNSCALGA